MVMTNPTAIKTALALMRRHPHWRFFPIASDTRAAPAGVVAAPNDSLRAADARSAAGYLRGIRHIHRRDREVESVLYAVNAGGVAALRQSVNLGTT
jgi:hypothetical protein